jgi:hypothetical protein
MLERIGGVVQQVGVGSGHGAAVENAGGAQRLPNGAEIGKERPGVDEHDVG